MMHKVMAKSFTFFLVVDLILVGWIVYCVKFNIQWLVNTKYILFTNLIRNAETFNAPPQIIGNMGFKMDSPESISAWSSIIQNKVNYMQGINRNSFPYSEKEKAKSIVLLFSKNGGSGCLDDIRLLDKLQKVSQDSGHGCCTDHSEVFIALSSIFGLPAREVHNVGHVFNEFFDQRANKWIWIDPLFALLAKNQYGEYLSLMEIRQMYYKDEKVDYECFGNDYYSFKHSDPHKHDYFDSKEDFSDIMVTWGNNVFEEDNFNQDLHYFPKFVRQCIGISMGVIPSYMIYADGNSKKGNALVRKKRIYIGLFGLLTCGTMTYPFYMIISMTCCRWREKERERCAR